MRIEKLLTAMMEYDHGDVPRIQHFVKVYEFARMIGLMEGLDAKTQFSTRISSSGVTALKWVKSKWVMEAS